jgi:DMSO/TMAO reductase YedYZ molybdopterin-dependent catalytic subunit
MSEHGQQQNDWTGPLLWNVLREAGVIDPAKPGEQVRLVARVTGSDGYVASFALGEISPEFAGRPVQLAGRMNGAAIPGGALRLIAPDERRGGRSVRDVVRVDVE